MSRRELYTRTGMRNVALPLSLEQGARKALLNGYTLGIAAPLAAQGNTDIYFRAGDANCWTANTDFSMEFLNVGGYFDSTEPFVRSFNGLHFDFRINLAHGATEYILYRDVIKNGIVYQSSGSRWNFYKSYDFRSPILIPHTHELQIDIDNFRA